MKNKKRVIRRTATVLHRVCFVWLFIAIFAGVCFVQGNDLASGYKCIASAVLTLVAMRVLEGNK